MTPAHRRHVQRFARQGGAALVTAMVLMLAVLVVGFSSVRAALADAQSARHERDRQVALRAAEAALLDAERELADTPPTSPRFAALAGAGFIAGCGKAGTDSHGLCTHAAPPSWQAVDLASSDPALVVYGTFSMRDLGGVVQQPRYLVELMPFNAAFGHYYRITALGFGQRTGTRVVLQSLYRKPPAAGAGAPEAPVGAPVAPPGTAAPAAQDPVPDPPGTPGPHEAPQAPKTPAAPQAPETPAAPDPPDPPGPPGTEGPPVAVSPAARPPAVAPPVALPAQRIGWREVANWPALHAAAK
jgi:type IV pilus assembly protein PilX